jgi:uncharacterized protein with WD repeat
LNSPDRIHTIHNPKNLYQILLFAGKYCVTHEPVLERLRRDHKNLKVWSCEDGELAASFHQKGVTEETWPFIQFDAEETHVFFTVKDAIVLYKTDGDMAKADRKVPLQGITLFSMGPSSRKHLAAFVPESSKPAVFALIDWSDGSTINRKSFHRVLSHVVLYRPTNELKGFYW